MHGIPLSRPYYIYIDDDDEDNELSLRAHGRRQDCAGEEEPRRSWDTEIEMLYIFFMEGGHVCLLCVDRREVKEPLTVHALNWGEDEFHLSPPLVLYVFHMLQRSLPPLFYLQFNSSFWMYHILQVKLRWH